MADASLSGGEEWDEKFDATEKWQVSAPRVRTILASQTC